jgi:hypothetical protein
MLFLYWFFFVMAIVATFEQPADVNKAGGIIFTLAILVFCIYKTAKHFEQKNKNIAKTGDREL